MKVENKTPIIAFAPHPWDEKQWMNRQHILSRLGRRGWEVVYDTGALNIWDRNSKCWKESGILSSSTNIDSISVFHAGKIFPRWQKYYFTETLATKFHVASLRKRLRLKKNEDIATICYHPMFWPYVKELNSSLSIYYAYDNFAKQGNWTTVMGDYQQQAISHADIVIASSQAIADSLPIDTTTNLHILENGVDGDNFFVAPNSPPEEYLNISSPRIIYTGTINRKVDIRMISHVAQKRPEWNWVLVGHFEENDLLSDEYLHDSVPLIKKLPNVFLLGQQDRARIPGFLHHADVLTMCYRSDRAGWWNDGSPLKLYEYFATGKPVVSSPLQTVAKHSAEIAFATVADQWEIKIDEQLNSNNLELAAKRKEIAKNNTWEARVDHLERLLQDAHHNKKAII